MNRTLRQAFVVVVVTGSLLLSITPTSVASARPLVVETPTGDVMPPVNASGSSTTVKPSSPTGNPADRWVGLPKVVAGKTATATTYAADLFSGLLKDPGNDLNLPGLHPAGTHVRRGHAPAIGAITVTKVGGRYVVKAPVTATSSIVGKRVKGSREDLFVSLTVRDGKGDNPSRQQTLKHQVSWARLAPGAKSTTSAVFTLDAATSAAIDAMPAAVRGKAITIDVVHAIDAAGVVVDGRHLADHVKVSSFDVASSRARVAGQGVGLTIANANYFSQISSWPAVNLTVNATSCMNTSGSQGSNPAALTTSGMTPNQSLESYLQAQDSTQQPANQASVAADVVTDMTETIAETVVELALSFPIEATNYVMDAAEDVVKAALSGCDENPGLFTIQATDMFGNNTNQAYALSEFFNDSGSMDASGGSGEQENGGAGGMADIQTAYNATQIPDYASDGTNYMIQNQGTYIQNTFLSSTNSFAPGQNGYGAGDSGLALQVQGNGLAAAQSMGGNNAYPNITLNVTNNNGCSSSFGGGWTNMGETLHIAGYWGSTGGYIQASCWAGWNTGNQVNPSAWGTPSIPASVGIGQTVTLTMPTGLQVNTALTTWYLCVEPTCDANAGGGGSTVPAGAVSLGTGATYTTNSSQQGQYIAALVYPQLDTSDVPVPVLTGMSLIMATTVQGAQLSCGAIGVDPLPVPIAAGTTIIMTNPYTAPCSIAITSGSAYLTWQNANGGPMNPPSIPGGESVAFTYLGGGSATVTATSPSSMAPPYAVVWVPTTYVFS